MQKNDYNKSWKQITKLQKNVKKGLYIIHKVVIIILINKIFKKGNNFINDFSVKSSSSFYEIKTQLVTEFFS